MEQTEIEKKAEEYIMREDVVTENDRVPVDNGYGWQTVSFEDEVKRAYIDGLAEGKPKWHDLRKNPNDLPKAKCLIVTRYHNGTYSPVHFYLGGKFSNDVIAWCELPKFKE